MGLVRLTGKGLSHKLRGGDALGKDFHEFSNSTDLEMHCHCYWGQEGKKEGGEKNCNSGEKHKNSIIAAALTLDGIENHSHTWKI